MADPAPASTAMLERRYRRLLFAYPPHYRAERSDEIVGTLLDCATADRRVPGSATDLIASGLRRRLAMDSIVGLDRGLVVAAPVALALAAGISAFAWWRVEPVGFRRPCWRLATVPYVLGWSPVLLVFAACFLVLAMSGRRHRPPERPGSAGAP